MKNKDGKKTLSDAEKSKKKLIRSVIFAFVAVIAFCIVFFQRNYLGWNSRYLFASVSEVAYGQNGHSILIDNSKKTVLLIDDTGVVSKRIDGGEDNSVFFYATHAAEGDDGSIYISEIKYGDRGNLLDRESIIRIKGNKKSILYYKDYSTENEADTPLQYGCIREMYFADGFLYYVWADNDNVRIYRQSGDNGAECIMEYALSGRINDVSYDVSVEKIVISYRNGDIVVADKNGGELVKEAVEDIIMADLLARGGKVYFTEMLTPYVGCFDVNDPSALTVLTDELGLVYKLDVAFDGSKALITDQAAFYDLAISGDTVTSCEYIEEASVAYFGSVIFIWFLLGIGIVFAFYPLYHLLAWYSRLVANSEQAMRVLFIVVASFAVAFILSYSMVGELMGNSTEEGEKKIMLFGQLMLSYMDADSLQDLDSPLEYHNDEYESIKGQLDRLIAESYKAGEYYYYILSRRNGDALACIMDYEDTSSILYPMYPYDLEPYHSVLETGEAVSYSENSAYGAWSFVLMPITNSDGEIVAELEVGQSLDALNKRRNDLVRDLALNVFICTLVIAMLLMEIAFLLNSLEKRRRHAAEELDPTERLPIRSIIFFSYLADSMQDAFIAVLCTDLYKGTLPLSDGIAVALPMSAQLLMMAVASAFAGKAAEALGTKRTLISGMLIELAGFITCFALGSYNGLLIGKMLIGTGMGIVYVCCNTAAAMAKTVEKSGEAYAGVTSGMLSGITIGGGLSSVLLSLGGWRLIYMVGIIIVTIGFLLCIGTDDLRPGKHSKTAEEKKGISMSKFFLNRRILPYFLLILVPFMIAISYREYFFPLFASENGFNEVSVGRLYLLCGMVVIYVGPVLSAKLLEKIGAYRSVVMSSLLLVVSMGLFIIYPSIITVICGIILFSLTVSFAYTVQYTFFGLLPECDSFGEGNSLGIYSVFESVGQTVGPVAYGAMLAFGYRSGIMIAAGSLLAAVLLYVVIMGKSGKMYSKEKA